MRRGFARRLQPVASLEQRLAPGSAHAEGSSPGRELRPRTGGEASWHRHKATLLPHWFPLGFLPWGWSSSSRATAGLWLLVSSPPALASPARNVMIIIIMW